jgi:aromatic-amino-acid transaminase
MFQHIPAYSGDPILSLMEDFERDPRSGKVSLSIGIYSDNEGRIPILSAVRQAERTLLEEDGSRSYLPMEGLAEYRAAVQKLVFGPTHEAVIEGRVATIQTVGGSGGLKVGGDFLRRYFSDSQVWVSDPTWENHRTIFENLGFEVNSYPYYDADTGGLRFSDMLATLQNLPRRSIVLMHACCHNPTGVDLSHDQWRQLIPIIRDNELVPYVDLAYQGFGDGLDADAFAPRALAAAGVRFFVANSFSKNMALYGERCGGLSVVCANEEEAQRVLGQLKAAIRANYSSPPTHGARVVACVLNTHELYAQWKSELAAMRSRMKAMRRALHARLTLLLPGRDLSFYLDQRGMFSYTGLAPDQVDRLRADKAVYLVRSGRLCIAGLSTNNVDRVAEAIAECERTAPVNG